jgi:hypothetical protein
MIRCSLLRVTDVAAQNSGAWNVVGRRVFKKLLHSLFLSCVENVEYPRRYKARNAFHLGHYRNKYQNAVVDLADISAVKYFKQACVCWVVSVWRGWNTYIREIARQIPSIRKQFLHKKVNESFMLFLFFRYINISLSLNFLIHVSDSPLLCFLPAFRELCRYIY